MKQKIGIIGYGNFGSLLYSLLKDDFDVFVYDVNKTTVSASLGFNILTKENVSQVDCLIFAIPAKSFEESVAEWREHVSEKTIVCDVASVKMYTEKILIQYFPQNQILCTHPLFGPESVKKGMKNLKVILSNTSCTQESFEKVKRFIEKKGFIPLEMSSQEHDKEMATVQALSHFIGFTLRDLNLTQVTHVKTLTFDLMYQLYAHVLKETDDLFETIQKFNPYAREVREEFIEKLQKINQQLNEKK